MCIGGKKFHFMRMFLVAQFGIFVLLLSRICIFDFAGNGRDGHLGSARNLDPASLLIVCLIPQHQHKDCNSSVFSEFFDLWNFLAQHAGRHGGLETWNMELGWKIGGAIRTVLLTWNIV